MSRLIFLCIIFASILSSANCFNRSSIPYAVIKDVDLKNVSRAGITFLVTISVNNPFNKDVNVPEIDYYFKSHDMDLVTANLADPGSLLPKSKTLLHLTIQVPSTILHSLVKDIRKDWDIDYEIGLKIMADFPAAGESDLLVSHEGTLHLPSWQLLLLFL